MVLCDNCGSKVMDATDSGSSLCVNCRSGPVPSVGGTNMPSEVNTLPSPTYDQVNQNPTAPTAPVYNHAAPPVQQDYQPQSQAQPPAKQAVVPVSGDGPTKYFGVRIGVCVLLGLLAWVTLFEFCALCTSSKLTTIKLSGRPEGHCGWKSFSGAGSDSAQNWSDCDSDACKDNESAGSTFIAMGVLSFFLLLGMFAILLDIDRGTLGVQIYCPISLWSANLACCSVVWLFMTCAWGVWVDQNSCSDTFKDSRHGDGTNLMITSWFFFTFFYVPFSIPMVQKMCFGAQACDP